MLEDIEIFLATNKQPPFRVNEISGEDFIKFVWVNEKKQFIPLHENQKDLEIQNYNFIFKIPFDQS